MRNALITLVTFALIPFAFAGCAKGLVESKAYNKEKLQSIDTWSVEFAYNDELSQQQAYIGENETDRRLISRGRLAADYQFRDDLYFQLQDNYGLRMMRQSSQAAGVIRILPVRTLQGLLESVSVLVTDHSGDIFARLKIHGKPNGLRLHLDKESFPECAAEAIAAALKSP